LAPGAQAPQERSADAAGRGPKGQRLQDISASSDAAVENDLRLPASGRHDLRQNSDGSRDVIELASAVIGHHHGAGTDFDGLFGVVRVEYPLDHDRTLPEVADARDIVPGDGGIEHGRHMLGDAGETRRRRALKIAETGRREEDASEPARTARQIKHGRGPRS